ncbi:MAG: YifB family Mg chelatase-like AAA ATPase [Candidatus Symbiodolus clandestinus]
MSFATIYTRASIGIEAPTVIVEVHISHGLPGFTLVGLAEIAVKEARDRVRSALLNSGFTFPAKRITVNLAPADLPKEGGRYDLAIALGILAASAQIPLANLSRYEFLGELGLSGALRAVTGIIPAALAAHAAKRQLITAVNHSEEVALVTQQETLVASDLLALCAYLQGKQPLPAATFVDAPTVPFPLDLQEVIGQQHAKRALEVAAAGTHHLLLLGPPGTGKTLLANRLPSILPPMIPEAVLETAVITCLVYGQSKLASWQFPPFRAPHHTASVAALVGGGRLPTPGEIALAHNGVLFLDELPEFERRALDALRQSLESGEITIARANYKVTFPARFQLIAAMNPSLHKTASTTGLLADPRPILRYLSRLSAPLLDRFDLSLEVPLLPQGTLSQGGDRGESSQVIQDRVIKARARQMERRGKSNVWLSSREVEHDCRLTTTDAHFLETALVKLGLSARAWHKLLKVSRTIADLEDTTSIDRTHLMEALSYRAMDRLLRCLNFR